MTEEVVTKSGSSTGRQLDAAKVDHVIVPVFCPTGQPAGGPICGRMIFAHA
ncbi:hypothetical protein [Bradyrhizobium sp. 199]|uniref:hypothetical protein n=1 Tax=Bradyrhizobium sp. 199 TaxID=2782664 RepID=UPI001FF8AE3A|nr:hypothetical protein [Bradyrhizobium sp. 199]MCK1358450.1 hypothetical protein [Bradyrhizobium sp. 199]